MNNGTDSCSVGEGGFLFCSVDSTDGGQELFFWVSLLQSLENLGGLESRISKLLHFLLSFIVKLSVNDVGSGIGRGGMIVTGI